MYLQHSVHAETRCHTHSYPNCLCLLNLCISLSVSGRENAWHDKQETIFTLNKRFVFLGINNLDGRCGFHSSLHCYLLTVNWDVVRINFMDFDTGSALFFSKRSYSQKFQPFKWMLQVNQKIIRHALTFNDSKHCIYNFAFQCCAVCTSSWHARHALTQRISIKWLNRWWKFCIHAVLMNNSGKVKCICIHFIHL